MVAPLAGSVDRNFLGSWMFARYSTSLPSRGAWIEICDLSDTIEHACVAPLAGSVDRNNPFST